MLTVMDIPLNSSFHVSFSVPLVLLISVPQFVWFSVLWFSQRQFFGSSGSVGLSDSQLIVGSICHVVLSVPLVFSGSHFSCSQFFWFSQFLWFPVPLVIFVPNCYP